jgi:homeobox-leucine zipper protein
MIIELAVAAMEELIRMAQMDEPLWMNSLDGIDAVLNEDEYIRIFPHGIGPKPTGFKCEASRESAVVIMNHINLVEYLMDVVSFLLVSFKANQVYLSMYINAYRSNIDL